MLICPHGYIGGILSAAFWNCCIVYCLNGIHTSIHHFSGIYNSVGKMYLYSWHHWYHGKYKILCSGVLSRQLNHITGNLLLVILCLPSQEFIIFAGQLYEVLQSNAVCKQFLYRQQNCILVYMYRHKWQ